MFSVHLGRQPGLAMTALAFAAGCVWVLVFAVWLHFPGQLDSAKKTFVYAGEVGTIDSQEGAPPQGKDCEKRFAGESYSVIPVVPFLDCALVFLNLARWQDPAITALAFAAGDGVWVLVFAGRFPEQEDSAKTASEFAAGVWALGVDLARKYHPVMPTFSFAVAVGVLGANLARQLNLAMPAFAFAVHFPGQLDSGK